MIWLTLNPGITNESAIVDEGDLTRFWFLAARIESNVSIDFDKGWNIFSNKTYNYKKNWVFHLF